MPLASTSKIRIMEYKDQKYTYLGGLIHGISTLATGMKTSIKVYFRKKVTEQYPENRKELKMFDRFRGTLAMPHNENNEHRCVACGLCQMACPNDTITVTSETIETEDGKKKKILAKYEYDLGACMFCQLCVNACPHDAITFDQNFEHAVFDRTKLVLQLNHAGSKGSLDMGSTLETVVFYFLAAFIIAMSIMTVTTQRIVRSATYLLFVLFGTAGIYFLLGYTFLGSVQIMVYAGGIVVLYVFSILLTSGEGDRAEKLKRSRFLAGLFTMVAGLAIILFITLKHNFLQTTNLVPLEINIHTIGNALLSSDKYGYILPFEAISILLLACIIGGIMIARKR